MVCTLLQSLKINLLLIVVQILLVSSPSQASRSRGYYDDNNDDNSYKPTYTNDEYEPTQEYKPHYNPTPTSPPHNPTPTSSSNPTQNPTSPPNPTQNPTSPPHNKDGQAQQRRHDTEYSSDKNSFLQGHNMARANLGLPPMTWDDKVASYARWWANQRINDCRVVHSDSSYGENVFWGSGGYSAAFAVQSWVNEHKHYDYNSNSCKRGMDCGHYTQIVWKKSTRLGCARVRCNDGGIFITCNYDPPGNYVGTRPY